MTGTPTATVVSRSLRTYERLLIALAVAIMAAIAIIMTTQVFFRYVLNDSLIWAEEICRYLLIWSTFIFVGAALDRGELAAVELLTSRLKPTGFRLCVIVGYGVCIGFLLVLAYYGWRYAAFNAGQYIPAVDFIWRDAFGASARLSIFWIYIAVPFGCIVLALHMLVRGVRLVVAGAPPPVMIEEE